MFASEGCNMGSRTKGTKQLFVEIADAIRDRLNERLKAERRTLRMVVEQALTFYMDNVPVDAALPAPEQPKRGRPKGKK